MPSSPSRALVDTGVLRAFLVSSDHWHLECKAVLREAPKPLLTTAAVITELFHFFVGNPHSVKRGWALLTSGAISIASIGNDDLPNLEALMLRYADRPMDFADASLVHVAGREDIATILTIDHDDFETYRLGRNRKFRILPARAGA